MSTDLTAHWDAVANALTDAKAITWDGCHKIYLAMDDSQVAQFRGYGYDDDPDLFIEVNNPQAALDTLHDWWDQSCGLRFISAVRTVTGDPNDGYDALIPQFTEPLRAHPSS